MPTRDQPLQPPLPYPYGLAWGQAYAPPGSLPPWLYRQHVVTPRHHARRSPSRHRRARRARSLYSSSTESGDTESEDAESEDTKSKDTESDDDTLDVYSSNYSGDAFFEGTHSATLTIRHGLPLQSQPRFRWTHLAQSSLDLAKLSAHVMSSPDLSRAEQHALSKVFVQIRRGSVTTCRAADGKDAKCLHIAQLWCVVIDNSKTRSSCRFCSLG